MTKNNAAIAFFDPDLREGVETALKSMTASVTTLDRAQTEHWDLAAEMGWLAACLDEANGGLGLGQAFAADLCEQAGRNLFCGPLAETAVLLPALAAQVPEVQYLLEDLGTGALRLGLVEDRPEGEVLVQHAQGASHILFIAPTEDGCLTYALAAAENIAMSSVQPMDLTCTVAWAWIDNEVPLLLCGELEPNQTAAVLAPYLTALAADLFGTGAAALERTVVHVLERYQFSQPIGKFQSVKHRLADIHTELMAARLSVACAVTPQATLREARMARILAADAALRATEAAIQLHGGLGFSWEMDLHLFLKRARRLNSSASGTARLRCITGGALIDEALKHVSAA